MRRESKIGQPTEYSELVFLGRARFLCGMGLSFGVILQANR